MDSIPADVQRTLDIDGLRHEILDRIGMEAYSEALNFVSGTLGGRLKAMQWQVIFQHLLVRRRNLCQRAGRDFYEVEKKAETAVKKLKSGDAHLDWLLLFLYTQSMLNPADNRDWLYAVDTMKSWPDLQ